MPILSSFVSEYQTCHLFSRTILRNVKNPIWKVTLSNLLFITAQPKIKFALKLCMPIFMWLYNMYSVFCITLNFVSCPTFIFENWNYEFRERNRKISAIGAKHFVVFNSTFQVFSRCVFVKLYILEAFKHLPFFVPQIAKHDVTRTSFSQTFR